MVEPDLLPGDWVWLHCRLPAHQVEVVPLRPGEIYLTLPQLTLNLSFVTDPKHILPALEAGRVTD